MCSAIVASQNGSTSVCEHMCSHVMLDQPPEALTLAFDCSCFAQSEPAFPHSLFAPATVAPCSLRSMQLPTCVVSTMGGTTTRCLCLLLLSALFVSCVTVTGDNTCLLTSYFNTSACAAGSETIKEYNPSTTRPDGILLAQAYECRQGMRIGRSWTMAELLSTSCATVINSEKAGMSVITEHAFGTTDCTGYHSVRRHSGMCIKFPASMGGGSIRTYPDETGQWVWVVSYGDPNCE